LPDGGILSPYARVRTHDVTPLRTYATPSTYAKTADVFWREIYPRWVADVILAGKFFQMGGIVLLSEFFKDHQIEKLPSAWLIQISL
jgi:hypothetical protein